jgi:serine/threonine protein kinase
MNVQQGPCNRYTIELFLDDRLDDTERTALEEHLSGCPVCRAHLDGLAAGSDWWQEAREYLPSLTPEQKTIEEEDEEGSLSAPAALRSYLAPTDDPRSLGRIGGYEIVGCVGVGGMGIVLKGFDGALNRYVAIKVLGPQLALSGGARQRFAREARAAAAVVHDNVVAIHAVAEVNGLPYFVMPYLRGPSLEKRLREGGCLTAVEVVRIGRQIAAGLAAAHAQGLVHRDVKPANILLEEGVERVTLTDFGLARAVDDASLTQSGTIAGTPQFMSPEQARGEAVDHRSDLFSLGSVLYALCTGRPPFRADSTLAVLKRVTEDQPRPIRDINPDVPALLAAVVERLMARDPRDRFQSAGEVATLLEGYLAHLRQPDLPAPKLPLLPEVASPPPIPRGSRLVRLVGLAAVVTALGLGLVFSFRPILRQILPGGPEKEQEKDRAGSDLPAGENRKQDHVVVNLRGGPDRLQPFSLVGPEGEATIQSDDRGLRISLPAGREHTEPLALETESRLSGDFDLTVGYEILAVGRPIPQYGAGVVIRVWFDGPSPLSVILSRSRKPRGDTFSAHRIVTDAAGKEQYVDNKDVKTSSPSGKLRLVRTGSRLDYLVLEGERFRPIQSLEIGSADVRSVRVSCNTMYKPSALDVRLTELEVRADRIEGSRPAPADPEPVPATGEKAIPRRWLVAVQIVGLISTLAILVPAAILYLRRRRESRAPAEEPEGPEKPAAIAFTCAACSKAIRVSAVQAGKKGRCKGCGAIVVVPERSASA